MREAARRATRLEELGERDERLELARTEAFRDLTQMLPTPLGVARAAAGGRLRSAFDLRGRRRCEDAVRHRLALGPRRAFDPLRPRRRLDGVRAQPRLHERPQALASKREPPLAFGA